MRFSLALRPITAAIFTTSMTSATALEATSPLQSLQTHAEDINALSQGSFTVLNMNAPLSQDVLVNSILSINADVVCLQGVFDEQAAYRLYESLQDQYAHFYIPVDSSGTFPTGLFIASKYAIENPQLTHFATQNNPCNNGFFDFIIMDGNTPLGHLYTVFSQPDPSAVSNLNQIAEKMQADFLATEKEDLPFFLCGTPLQDVQEEQNIIDAYFLDASDRNSTNHTLLLQSLPFYSIRIDHKHTLETTQVHVENQIAGLLSILRKHDETDSPLKKRKTVSSNENLVALCKHKDSEKDAKDSENKNKNEVHGSVEADNDGGRGDLRFEHKNKKGYEIGIKGNGRVDSHGNVRGEAELEVRKKF